MSKDLEKSSQKELELFQVEKEEWEYVLIRVSRQVSFRERLGRESRPKEEKPQSQGLQKA